MDWVCLWLWLYTHCCFARSMFLMRRFRHAFWIFFAHSSFFDIIAMWDFIALILAVNLSSSSHKIATRLIQSNTFRPA